MMKVAEEGPEGRSQAWWPAQCSPGGENSKLPTDGKLSQKDGPKADVQIALQGEGLRSHEYDFRTSLANTTAGISSLFVQITTTGQFNAQYVELVNREDQWCLNAERYSFGMKSVCADIQNHPKTMTYVYTQFKGLMSHLSSQQC